MNWLTKEEALRSAFNYRKRGNMTRMLILITDFDPKNPRVIEVKPGVWDDPKTWEATERKMRDDEFQEINWLLSQPHYRYDYPIGTHLSDREGYPICVRGYIKRARMVGDEIKYQWEPTLNIDEVNARIFAEKGGEPPEDEYLSLMTK